MRPPPGPDLFLDTLKRYARATRPRRLQRVPQYPPTLVDPFGNITQSNR